MTCLQEGAFTAAFGLISMAFMPAAPADMPFLTQDERKRYLRELEDDWCGDADDEADRFSWSEVMSAFVDAPHAVLLCFPMFFNGITVRGQVSWRQNPSDNIRFLYSR